MGSDSTHLLTEDISTNILPSQRRAIIVSVIVTAAGGYAAIACEPAALHFQGSSSSILVFG